jgi:hypothetical protein
MAFAAAVVVVALVAEEVPVAPTPERIAFERALRAPEDGVYFTVDVVAFDPAEAHAFAANPTNAAAASAAGAGT